MPFGASAARARAAARTRRSWRRAASYGAATSATARAPAAAACAARAPPSPSAPRPAHRASARRPTSRLYTRVSARRIPPCDEAAAPLGEGGGEQAIGGSRAPPRPSREQAPAAQPLRVPRAHAVGEPHAATQVDGRVVYLPKGDRDAAPADPEHHARPRRARASSAGRRARHQRRPPRRRHAQLPHAQHAAPRGVGVALARGVEARRSAARRAVRRGARRTTPPTRAARRLARGALHPAAAPRRALVPPAQPTHPRHPRAPRRPTDRARARRLRRGGWRWRRPTTRQTCDARARAG